MTRDAEHTPSPQSVVVPVEPTEAMLVSADNAVGRMVASDASQHDFHNAVYRAMLAAAPAPSSLAGGAISEMAFWSDDDWEMVFAHRPDLRDRMRAALSPEAPARVVGTIAHVSNGLSELAAQITAAPTPRHEAPAEGAGELIQRIVGNCGGFVPKGEDLRLCVEALEAAFRARSSAPEARETKGCAQKQKPGGCQLPNVQCLYPERDK